MAKLATLGNPVAWVAHMMRCIGSSLLLRALCGKYGVASLCTCGTVGVGGMCSAVGLRGHVKNTVDPAGTVCRACGPQLLRN